MSSRSAAAPTLAVPFAALALGLFTGAVVLSTAPAPAQAPPAAVATTPAAPASAPAAAPTAAAPADPAAPPSLADEMKRLPPVEIADVQATFKVQHGFSLELVAHEPDVLDPVDACFDAYGRLYVAEMLGYPYSEEVREMQPMPLGKKNACQVRRLEDTDGDGIFDKSTVYADKMSWVVSVCCYDDGVFALAPDKLYYFKDTNGDGVADERKEIIEGFSRYNVQGLANNMKWGLDNRITASGGTAQSSLQMDGKDVGPLRASDWALNPKTNELTRVTGGQQFGHSYDDWGNRFVCNNSNHIQHIVYPRQALDRKDSGITAPPIRSVAADGAAAPVFRTSPAEPWRVVRTRRRAADPAFRKRVSETELVATGFFTSATGVTIYRGDAYPPEFFGNAFIGDVGGNLIHRKTVGENGASFLAQRADQGIEFITSTDTWFRPTNFVNGPDGCLYVLDMYRETIEHPIAIPDDIKAFLNLESGDDKGRIYRLTPPGWKHRPFPVLATKTTVELVASLNSTNGWERETAQRLLWERQDKAAIEPARKLVREGSTPLGRLHALAVLDGLDAIEEGDMLAALADRDPHVRERAVWLAAPRIKAMPALAGPILALSGEDNVRVEFAVAYALGEIDSPKSLKALTALATRPGLNSDVLEMLTSSIGTRALPLLDELLAKGDQDSPWRRRLLARAAATDEGVLHILNRIASLPDSPARSGMIATLGGRLESSGKSLASLVGSPKLDAPAKAMIDGAWTAAEGQATDSAAPLKGRLAVMPIVATLPADRFAALLEKLLSPQTPPELQGAAITTVGGLNADLSAPLLAVWAQMGPQLRAVTMTTLLKRNERITALLTAVGGGGISPGEVDPTSRQTLLSHPNEAIRKQAAAVFGTPNQDRQKVIESYRPALELAGDVARGKLAFTKHCVTCHKIGNEGANVGPQLVSVVNKSPEDLLIAILDPNREAQAIYQSYTVITDAGRVLNGLIAADTADAVTLRMAEGKEEAIPRGEIEVLKANGVSLMPVGLEKTVTPQEIADLIALIKSQATPAPQ